MPKLTFYFSHDYNARNDEKIKLLIRKHGMEGYGIYWSIVEDLYNNANALRTDYDGIAFDMRTQCEIVKSVVEDFGLFEISENFFGSKSVQRRLDEVNIKSLKARESASYRWSDANALRAQSDRNAINKRKERNKRNIENTKDSTNFYEKEKQKINKKQKEKDIPEEPQPPYAIPQNFGRYYLPKYKVVVFEDETCQPLSDLEFELLETRQLRSWLIQKDFGAAKPLSEVVAEHQDATRRTETAQISRQIKK